MMKFKTIIVILFILVVSSFAQQDYRKIALIPMKNDGSSSMDWVAGGLEYVLNNKLSVISGFFVIDKNTVKNVLSQIKFESGKFSEKNAGSFGRITNAQVTISGSFKDSGSIISFDILYHNSSNGRLIFSETLKGSTDELSNIADQIVNQVLRISGVRVTPAEQALINRILTKNQKAYESFIRAYAESGKPNPNMNLIIGLFNEAIAKDRNFWEAYYNLGITYFNNRQYQQSLIQFNKVISALPNFDKPYYGRGLIYEKQKQYDLAIADFKQVTELNPNDYKPYYYLGKISILNNNFAEAKQYLDKAVEMNPDYAPCYYEYGNLQVAQEQIRKSIVDYRRAVDLDPTNIQYKETLGEIYYRSQIYYNALIEFQNILKTDPNHAVANFMLGVTIYKQAVLEELVVAFLDMLEESNTPQPQVKEEKFKKTLAIDPLKKKKVYEDMVDAFLKAAEARPQFMQATFNLALTFFEMGNLSFAEKYFKATILIAPDLVRAHTKLAEIYEKTNRLPDALEQYKKVFYIDPSIFVRTPTLGPEHHYKNILKEFLDDLDDRIRRNPGDVNANIVLAKVFRAQGFNGKAANILRSILTRNPSNEEAKTLLARIEKSQRN